MGVIGVERISGEADSVGVVDSEELELRPRKKKVITHCYVIFRIDRNIGTYISVNVNQKILWNGGTDSQMECQTFQPDLNDFTRRSLIRIEIAAKESDPIKRFRAIETKFLTESSLIETKVT